MEIATEPNFWLQGQDGLVLTQEETVNKSIQR